MLVVADMSGTAAATRILLAAPLDPAEAEIIAADRVTDTQETAFDAASGSLRARQVRRLGAIVIEAKPLPVPAEMASAEILAAGIARIGLSRLPWSKAQEHLRNRVAFVRQAGDLSLPNLSDEALSQSVAQWLAPAVVGRTRLSEITAEDLDAALDTLLPWDARRRLDNEAPTHYEAPTGNRHPIHYDGAQAPLLSIRVQELFGLKAHPTIVGGRLPLTLELLSPAHRPIQVTRDLPGFWRGSWHDVVRDMRGRYPRHPWPDDPASAAPTTRAKPRGR
jgi:ATP-dependent helicase HrpB